MFNSYRPLHSKTEKELLEKIDQIKEIEINDDLILRLEAFSSTSVRSSDIYYKKWVEASISIEELNEKEIFSVDSLVRLNKLLTGNHGLRKENVYAGYSEFPSAIDLEKLLNLFLEEASNIENTVSRAAFTYQCLLCIHPFSDGNGRLSRLIASKILTTENYMPLAFSDQGAGFVIPKTKEDNYHYIALQKTLASHRWLFNISLNNS